MKKHFVVSLAVSTLLLSACASVENSATPVEPVGQVAGAPVDVPEEPTGAGDTETPAGTTETTQQAPPQDTETVAASNTWDLCGRTVTVNAGSEFTLNNDLSGATRKALVDASGNSTIFVCTPSANLTLEEAKKSLLNQLFKDVKVNEQKAKFGKHDGYIFTGNNGANITVGFTVIDPGKADAVVYFVTATSTGKDLSDIVSSMSVS